MLANNVVKERKPPIYRRYLPVIKCVYFVLTSTKKAHKKIPLTLTSQGYNKIKECFTPPPNQPHQKTQADIAMPENGHFGHFDHFEAWSPRVAKGFQGPRGTPGMGEMSYNQIDHI